jgi:PAS domain S-box-containing protein
VIFRNEMMCTRPIHDYFADEGGHSSQTPSPVISMQSQEVSEYRVLIVNDNHDVRKLVHRFLDSLNAEIVEVGSATEAAELLKSSLFDIVLINLDMCRCQDFDVIDALAKYAQDFSLILLSSIQDVPQDLTALKCGVIDYISNPPCIEDLRRAVNYALRYVHMRRRERSLAILVAEWEAIFDACPDCMFVIDAQKRILKSNRAMQRQLGRSAQELSHQYVRNLFSEVLSAAIDAAVSDGLPQKVFDFAIARHYIVSASPITEQASIAVIRDLTDFVEPDNTLVRLYRKVLTLQEEERGRLARELHDGIAQSIVLLSLGLKNIADKLQGSDAADADRLATLSQSACDVLDEIRRIARGLRPRILDDLGLAVAIEQLTREFAKSHEIDINFTVSESFLRRFPEFVELNIYRIVQEALSNVARHSNAKSVTVALEFGERMVAVTIADDGNGQARECAHGMGLADMRERTELLGGTFRLQTKPGHGTTIRIEIPIQETTE